MRSSPSRPNLAGRGYRAEDHRHLLGELHLSVQPARRLRERSIRAVRQPPRVDVVPQEKQESRIRTAGEGTLEGLEHRLSRRLRRTRVTDQEDRGDDVARDGGRRADAGDDVGGASGEAECQQREHARAHGRGISA
jgi:hypothetical protein